VVSPTEQLVAGNAFAAVGVNRSHPVLVANHLAEPRDVFQSALRISGEALLLLG